MNYSIILIIGLIILLLCTYVYNNEHIDPNITAITSIYNDPSQTINVPSATTNTLKTDSLLVGPTTISTGYDNISQPMNDIGSVYSNMNKVLDNFENMIVDAEQNGVLVTKKYAILTTRGGHLGDGVGGTWTLDAPSKSSDNTNMKIIDIDWSSLPN